MIFHLALLLLCFNGLAEQPASISFSRDIQPILQRNCAGCHRPGKSKGDLDLSQYDALMKGGGNGAAIEPGKPANSLLLKLVSGTSPEMPEKGEPLTSGEIDLLTRWIESGATNDALAQSAPRLAVPSIYHSLPAVTSIAYGPESILAVAGHREVLLYDAQGDLIARLVGQLPKIDSIAYSPDGKFLAVAASDPSVRGEIQLWNAATHELLSTYPVSNDSLFGVSFSPSGDRLAMGGADRIVRVVEIPSGKELVRFANHTDWVFGAGFSHDGNYMVSGGRDSSLRVIASATGKFVAELAPSREPILTLAVHPSAPQVVYGGEKGGIRVYKLDPREGFKEPGDNKLHVRDYDHLGAAVYALSYSRDGKWVAVGGERDEVRVHQSDNGQRVATLRGHRGAIYACAFDPSGNRIATAGQDGLIRVYKLPAGELLQNFASVPLSPSVARLSQTQTQPAIAADPSGPMGTVSFRQDVLPILTRAGCNAGGCHGKLAGQNGFRLSLRGFAPELDYDWLTSEIRARRVDFAFPEESLFLRKALGLAPHEGGRRFAEDSPYFRTLAAWIAQRAPGPRKNEEEPDRLEVLRDDGTLQPGEKRKLLVRAHYPNGRVRDVTWLAQFFSNDESTLSVTLEGEVEALRHGEAGVRAHFQELVEVVRFTIPHTNSVPPGFYARRVNPIDDAVFEKLRALGIPPSPDSDDATFFRRASLDATGTLPSPEKVTAFVSSHDPNKRARVVDELLESEAFIDYWSLQLADLFQNRKERDHDVRGTKGVRAFHVWLRQQLAQRKPWDQIARALLTATGDSVNSPEIGYYITTIGEFREVERSEVADSVAQVFLGARIGCAKCHNHPLERYTQDDYYRFAAFFAKTSLERKNPEEGRTELLIASRSERDVQRRIRDLTRELEQSREQLDQGGDGKSKNELEKRIEQKQKELEQKERELAQKKVEMPTVEQPRTKARVGPQPLDRSGIAYEPGSDPRKGLVGWLTSTNNEAFSGAMINRLWKHFMSVGLVEPVDDLRASNPPTNPALWEFLKSEFIRSDYDLRHVMRLILNSRAYQLSSETLPGNETDAKFYSHYYPRRLPAEVLLDAISAATAVPDTFEGYPVGMRAVQLPEPHVANYFLGLFGRSERVTACACERNGEVTLPQVLNLQNGNELAQKLKSPQGRLKAALQRNDSELARELFLATLNRPPRAPELAALQSALGSGDERDQVFEDLFWALLNSKEFVFNH